jgi:uncharacterized HhH-GPD family protein
MRPISAPQQKRETWLSLPTALLVVSVLRSGFQPTGSDFADDLMQSKELIRRPSRAKRRVLPYDLGVPNPKQEARPRINFVDDYEADTFISEDALALLIGMVLDQQQTIEKAFRGPLDLAKRMDREPIPGALDAAEIAAMPAEELKALFSIVPALHRFPASNAARIQELCAHIVEKYNGEPAALWTTASDAASLYKRMKAVPGFGERKARIFVAVVGKRLGIELPGWREAAGEFGEAGVLRSVADIEGPETKAAYRELKKAAKENAGPRDPSNAKPAKVAKSVRAPSVKKKPLEAAAAAKKLSPVVNKRP